MRVPPLVTVAMTRLGRIPAAIIVLVLRFRSCADILSKFETNREEKEEVVVEKEEIEAAEVVLVVALVDRRR